MLKKVTVFNDQHSLSFVKRSSAMASHSADMHSRRADCDLLEPCVKKARFCSSLDDQSPLSSNGSFSNLPFNESLCNLIRFKFVNLFIELLS